MMLLDTCALLWLAHDQSKISPDTLSKIESAPAVYLLAISGFEIGLKCRAGKLTLPMPPADWIKGVVEHHNLSILDLDLKTCLKATELPPIHRDPCDRPCKKHPRRNWRQEIRSIRRQSSQLRTLVCKETPASALGCGSLGNLIFQRPASPRRLGRPFSSSGC
jgi:PIN domain nuclease of toxin-antitoxin system